MAKTKNFLNDTPMGAPPQLTEEQANAIMAQLRRQTKRWDVKQARATYKLRKDTATRRARNKRARRNRITNRRRQRPHTRTAGV